MLFWRWICASAVPPNSIHMFNWGFCVLLWSFYSSPRLSFHSSLCLHVLPEYLEVVWRSLASENVECPLLVKMASDSLVERLKDPKTYDNITKDFKYRTFTPCNHSFSILLFAANINLTKARDDALHQYLIQFVVLLIIKVWITWVII